MGSYTFETNYKTSSTDIGSMFTPGSLVTNAAAIYVSSNNSLEYGDGTGSFVVPTATTSNPNSWYLVTMIVTYSGTTSWTDVTYMVCGLLQAGTTEPLYQWLSVAGAVGSFFGPFYHTTWISLPSGKTVQPYIIKNGSNAYTATFTIYINSQPPALT